MKMHRVIAFVLTLCTISAFCITALADSNDSQTNVCNYTEFTDSEGEVVPCNATGSFSGVLSGEYVNYDMIIHGDYRYWKMTVTNTGSTDIQVNVNGQVFQVSAHTTGYIYSTSRWGAGTYSVGFSSKVPGIKMKGSVSCTLYTTLEESQP